MKPKRIHSLIDLAENLCNEFTCWSQKTQPEYENMRVKSGCKGNSTAIKRLLEKCCADLHISHDFMDDSELKQKIFEDEQCNAVLYFQSYYPPEVHNSQEHIHWGNFRHDDWVRQHIHYTFVNSGNLGSEAYSPVLEIAEILRINELLGDCRGKTASILFVPDKPNSPVPAHSEIIASILSGMNVNLMCPESHPLDFEVLSKAETYTFTKQQDFKLFLKPDKEALKESDVIIKASWAQLGKDFDYFVQMNKLTELRKTWNEILVPDNSQVLNAFSYPNFMGSESTYVEKALKILLQYLLTN